MVAKGVKRATAPTKTCGEWEVQTKTTEKENPEEVGWIFELCGVRYGGEGSACKGASLGVKQTWLAGGITAWSSLDMAVWTGVVACCCHPRVLGAFSSGSVSAGLGRFLCASSSQFGGVQPCSSSACAAPAAAWMLGIAGEGCWRCCKIWAAYWGSWVWSTGSESAHDDQKAGLARVAAQVRPRPP